MKIIKTKFSPDKYQNKYPEKANVIKKAVKRGLKEYAETFRRLANT